MELVNNEFQEMHNKHIPNLESKIEKEEIERTKLELWGSKWNVVIRGVSGERVDREFPKITQTLVRQCYICFFVNMIIFTIVFEIIDMRLSNG